MNISAIKSIHKTQPKPVCPTNKDDEAELVLWVMFLAFLSAKSVELRECNGQDIHSNQSEIIKMVNNGLGNLLFFHSLNLTSSTLK